MTKRTSILWDTSSLGNIENIPNRRCLPPIIVKRTLDLNSTIPFYDELGRPKKWIPASLNPAGEWVYSLNPNQEPLRGISLMLHLQAVKGCKLKIDKLELT